jgi:hypothetical protein
MRAFALIAVVPLIALMAVWLTWPVHPTDAVSCEIARVSGSEPETDVERCEAALAQRTVADLRSDVFIHRQMTLVNAGQSAAQFLETSGAFAKRIDQAYSHHDRKQLLQMAAIVIVLLLSSAAARRLRWQ